MENFFDYIANKYPSGERQDLMLLYYAVNDGDKALRLLKGKIEGEKKNLLFHYPGVEDKKQDLSGYDVIGTIPDGILLIEK
jgi:hypothetical protein